ncbi:MAG TPA: hypothetical protein VN226_08595 [Anaerolineales bacterium]|nr:hypothetical protein [Anaerolineales bacterium]
MDDEYGGRSKIFSQVIRKNSVKSKIQTTSHLIEGNIHIQLDNRVIDELVQNDDFIAVTEATVFDADGKDLYKVPFLTINRSHIIWVMPEEE